MIQLSDALDPSAAAEVQSLAAAATTVDGVAPLSEQTLLRLEGGVGGVRHLLARQGPELVGYAQVDGGGVAELVVRPSGRRRGTGGSLVAELDRVTPGGSVQIWAHGQLPAAASLAARAGYASTRVLLQLRRSLAEPLPDPNWPVDVRVRTFVPGADEKAWLVVNNAAFATHPEQGRWTPADIAQREAKPWFDPAGFFLAERDGEIVGFHWTKVHAEENPPVGEVYVVGVRPADSGQGLGPALTLTGLHYLRSLGLDEVLLYVDEGNVPAVKTYERLGFRRWSTDVLYAREDHENDENQA